MKLKTWFFVAIVVVLCASCSKKDIAQNSDGAPIVQESVSTIEPTPLSTEIPVEIPVTDKEKFPLWEKDGYMYWLEVSDQVIVPMPIYQMCRSKLDGGNESVLDGLVFASDYMRSGVMLDSNFADVYLFDNRIVFRGYPDDDFLTLKHNPTFISIALDGSDRKVLERSEPNFQNPIAQGDYIYFGEITDYQSGVPSKFVVNRVRYDLEKYQKVLEIDGEFLTLHNNVIYYVDKECVNIVSVPTDGGEKNVIHTFTAKVKRFFPSNDDKSVWCFEKQVSLDAPESDKETFYWEVPTNP